MHRRADEHRRQHRNVQSTKNVSDLLEISVRELVPLKGKADVAHN